MIPSRALLVSLVAISLVGCDADAPSWSLASVYDASAVSWMSADVLPDPAAAYVWVPSGGMQANCGPAKAPDGLGVFEAEAMANGLSPVLAVLLERHQDAPPAPLTMDDVWLSIGDDAPEFRLHPTVQPRHVSMQIIGNDLDRVAELVRTQVQMELCMEHKTGRAWIAAEETQLRQAFLLDPPGRNAGPDRKYFGGQRDPVPALLGPSDACLVYDAQLEGSRSQGGRGEGSLDIVPADVWGADVRWCNLEEKPGYTVRGVTGAPLRLSEMSRPPAPQREPVWSQLEVALWPPNAAIGQSDIEVSITWQGRDLVQEAVEGRGHNPPASWHVTRTPDGRDVYTEPLYEMIDGGRKLKDPLGRVPYEYPTLGTVGDPERYTLLLVPNWQVVEGLRRLHADHPDDPLAAAGAGVQDGVGFVLEHPELLYVQVKGLKDAQNGGFTVERGLDGAETRVSRWYNIGSTMRGGIAGYAPWLSYGYTTGMLSGRKPIALFGYDAPTWNQVAAAQRSSYQSLFLGSAALLGVLFVSGLRRVRDLWATVPEERVDFWPGQILEEEEEEAAAHAAPEIPAEEG
jgi:hypothetical protein